MHRVNVNSTRLSENYINVFYIEGLITQKLKIRIDTIKTIQLEQLKYNFYTKISDNKNEVGLKPMAI
jgi:hypothetical protein